MGMDQYLEKIKRDPNNKSNILEREELCYWRKFYGLNDELRYDDDMYGKDLVLTKKELEMMLDYVSHNRDYFDSFQTVEQVCEALDHYDELKKDGWAIVYNSNW